jgi:futalosine hydrolase
MKKKILIVSATKLEINPFLLNNKIEWQTDNIAHYQTDNYNITLLISGVGAPATLYSVTKLVLSQHFDVAFHVGICGHYGDNLTVGDIIRIQSDCFADLGIDNRGSFSNIFQMGFAQEDTFPFSKGKLTAPNLPEWDSALQNICQVDALTVNTATGSTQRANELQQRCPQGVETMESAAFMYVAINEHVSFVSLRAVSNKVEARNFPSWNIPLAVENLNNLLINLFKN